MNTNIYRSTPNTPFPNVNAYRQQVKTLGNNNRKKISNFIQGTKPDILKTEIITELKHVLLQMETSESFTKTELTSIRTKTMKTKKKMTELINLLFKKKKKRKVPIVVNAGVQTTMPNGINNRLNSNVNRNGIANTSLNRFVNVNMNGVNNRRRTNANLNGKTNNINNFVNVRQNPKRAPPVAQATAPPQQSPMNNTARLPPKPPSNRSFIEKISNRVRYGIPMKNK